MIIVRHSIMNCSWTRQGFLIVKCLCYLCVALLFLNACNLENVKQKDTSDKFAALKAIPYNTSIEIRIPTYDRSNQAVHPDILPLQISSWSSVSLAMVFTPYPYFNDKMENPSIIISKDGINFYEPIRDMNPLASAPPYDHNCDPDIVFNPDNGYYYLHYLEACRPDSLSVKCLTSRDLKNWDNKTAILYNVKESPCFVVSPSLIRKQKNSWLMYYVNAIWNPLRIEYLCSNDGATWHQENPVIPAHSNMPSITPWHLDVFKGGDKYYMLVCGIETDPNLYIARSNDLHNWEWRSEPILIPGSATLKSTRIYRSTGFVTGDDLFVYFSYIKSHRKWGIGLHRFNLKQLF